MSLVLNPRTGHVSPQFHVKHNEFFETVNGRHSNSDALAATWKELSGLALTKSKNTVPSMIRHLREQVDVPMGATDHMSQGVHHMNPLEVTEDTNQIEEVSAAASPCVTVQEELDASLEHPDEQRQTHSSRVVHNTACYSEGLEQQEKRIVTWEVLVNPDEAKDMPMAQRQYKIQKQMQQHMAYAVSANPDIMYLHEAMKADTIYIKTQVFRLLRYYSPAPRNVARSDWVTQNITHNMTSSLV